MTYVVGGLRLDRPFRIRRIGHFGFHSADLAGTLDFLTRKLGLAISDVDDFRARVPQLHPDDATGYFLRCASDHHTIVLGSQALVDTREPDRKGATVGQVSWQVGTLKEVFDGVDYLDEKARLRRIGRDTPGSNWHAYAYCPDGYINELFYGMEQIGWDGYSKPASMYDRGYTSRPELPQIPEAEEVNRALARGDVLDGFRAEEGRGPTHDVGGVLMERPFKLTRLGRILLFVEDMETALAFYRDVLGLAVTEFSSVLGHDCAFLRAEDEHHTLVLCPQPLREALGCAAAIGFAVADYAQLKAARGYLEGQGVRIRNLPAALSAGVHYGFWAQGPDKVAVHIYYGVDRVGRDGAPPRPTTFPVPEAAWPETIEHGGAAWFEPAFLGPLA